MSAEFPYLHGFSPIEQQRLRKQAEYAEQSIFTPLNFSHTKKLLEVGCGVGAQSEIILRRYPKIHLTGIDLSDAQLQAASKSLAQLSYAKNRSTLLKMDATQLDFEAHSFDGAFLCWVLEHMPEPMRVLSEVRRVLTPGGTVVINEVMNSSFFLEPYSPHVWQYWMSFNDYQTQIGGDPFIGMKLGNMLLNMGFRNIVTTPITWHYDNRHPQKRREQIEFWSDLLLSASSALRDAGMVTQELIDNASLELKKVKNDPNAVFHYSFMQAQAQAY
jgi:SAM-dependent methyltransferase